MSWIKESWDDIDIDINSIAQEIIVGPSNRVARAMMDVNNRYITCNYMSGNRSMLEPLKPLGFTRTYRWSPGYQDIIKECITNRIQQIDKKGTIVTMFNRMRRNDWNLQNFKDRILAIDEMLKDLRSRNVTTDSDLEIATENLQVIFDKLNEKAAEADLIFGLRDDIEHKLSFEYYNDERYKDIDEEQIELLRFLTGRIRLQLHIKNPKIELHMSRLDGREVNKKYGQLKLAQDLYMSFSLPFYPLFQSLFTTSFENLNWQDLHQDYRARNTISTYLIRANMESNVQATSFGSDRAITAWCGSKNAGLRNHPYVGNGHSIYDYTDHYSSFDDFGVRMSGHHVCFGNMDDTIRNAFTKLDFVELISLIEDWNRWDVYDTNPLNNIAYCITTLPAKDIDASFITDSGNFNAELVHQNLMNDIHADYKQLREDSYFSQPRIEYNSYPIDRSYSNNVSSEHNAMHEYGNPREHTDYSSVPYYGWNFSHHWWTPNQEMVRRISLPCLDIGMLDYSDYVNSDGEEVLTDDYDTDSEDGYPWVITEKIVIATMEYIYANICRVVHILDEDECITRDYGWYKQMKDVIDYVENGCITNFDLDVQQDIERSRIEDLEEAEAEAEHHDYLYYQQQMDNAIEREYNNE